MGVGSRGAVVPSWIFIHGITDKVDGGLMGAIVSYCLFFVAPPKPLGVFSADTLAYVQRVCSIILFLLAFVLIWPE